MNLRAAARNTTLQVTRRDRESTEDSEELIMDEKIEEGGDIGLVPHIGSFNENKEGG